MAKVIKINPVDFKADIEQGMSRKEIKDKYKGITGNGITEIMKSLDLIFKTRQVRWEFETTNVVETPNAHSDTQTNQVN